MIKKLTYGNIPFVVTCKDNSFFENYVIFVKYSNKQYIKGKNITVHINNGRRYAARNLKKKEIQQLLTLKEMGKIESEGFYTTDDYDFECFSPIKNKLK